MSGKSRKPHPKTPMTRSGFKAALEEILQLPCGSLQESDSRETVAGWSSIADVQILTTITSEFELEPDTALLEAETVSDLLDALETKNVFSS
jgi:acyl carrier protein